MEIELDEAIQESSFYTGLGVGRACTSSSAFGTPLSCCVLSHADLVVHCIQ